MKDKMKLKVNWEAIMPRAVEPEECALIAKAIRIQALDAAIEAIRLQIVFLGTYAGQYPRVEGHNDACNDSIKAIEKLKEKG